MRIRPKKANSRFWLSVLSIAVGLGGIVVGILAGVSCTPERRVKTLSFFFDGVTPAAQPEQITPPLSTAAGLLPRQDDLQIKQALVSFHKSYKDHDCAACHNPFNLEQLRVPKEYICDLCHKEMRMEKKWFHGPINIGECAVCHYPHQSAYPHLVVIDTDDICLQCHQRSSIQDTEDHLDLQGKTCLECHDPHTGESREEKDASPQGLSGSKRGEE